MKNLNYLRNGGTNDIKKSWERLNNGKNKQLKIRFNKQKFFFPIKKL